MRVRLTLILLLPSFLFTFCLFTFALLKVRAGLERGTLDNYLVGGVLGAGACGRARDCLRVVHALYDAAEDRVVVVPLRDAAERDEELAVGGVYVRGASSADDAAVVR